MGDIGLTGAAPSIYGREIVGQEGASGKQDPGLRILIYAGLLKDYNKPSRNNFDLLSIIDTVAPYRFALSCGKSSIIIGRVISDRIPRGLKYK